MRKHNICWNCGRKVLQPFRYCYKCKKIKDKIRKSLKSPNNDDMQKEQSENTIGPDLDSYNPTILRAIEKDQFDIKYDKNKGTGR